MLARVSGCGEKSRKNYVGRGIYVCPRWTGNFADFAADMGPKPTPGHTIERVSNAGSYTCGKCDDCMARGAVANCQWATRVQQMRNMRRNRLTTFRGETLTTAEWSERTGMDAVTIKHRLDRGWTIERALTQPESHHPRVAPPSLRFNLTETA